MLERQLLSSCGSDRATEYNNSSKIIRLADKLLIGWLDAAEGAVGPTRLRLGICSPCTGALQNTLLLGEAFDNHCGPALALDKDQRLHVMLGAHHQPFRYLWTDDLARPQTQDYSSTHWSNPEVLGPEDTYPSLITDAAGTLHLLYRAGGERWQLWYRRKRPGQGWEHPHVIAISPVAGYNNFFHSISVGPGGALHLLFQFHYSLPGDKLVPGRFAVYLHSDDGGETWLNEGKKCAFPLTPTSAECFRAYPEGGLRLSGGHVVDAQDRPWIHVTTPDQGGGALLCRGSSGWKEIDISGTLGKFNLQDGHGRGISLSRSASGHIHLIVATNPDAQPAGWFDPRHELFHLVLTEEGKTVSFRQLTETDPTTANWLPALEKWDWTRPKECCVDDPWLIYTRGWNLGNAWGSCRNSLRTEVYLMHPTRHGVPTGPM